MTEIDYEARVAAGIALLDVKVPAWPRILNPVTTDIRNWYHCVTAQIAQHVTGDSGATFEEGMEFLGLEQGDANVGSYTAHGFNAEEFYAEGIPEGYHQGEAYATLNAIWRREILARRSAVGAS